MLLFLTDTLSGGVGGSVCSHPKKKITFCNFSDFLGCIKVLKVVMRNRRIEEKKP